MLSHWKHCEVQNLGAKKALDISYDNGSSDPSCLCCTPTGGGYGGGGQGVAPGGLVPGGVGTGGLGFAGKICCLTYSLMSASLNCCLD